MRPDPRQPLLILTGAGISAESGIRTFRDANGLWEEHAIEEVASPEGFAANPDLVHRFYNQRRLQLFEVAPNAAHRALARLEQHWPGGAVIITQNVDDLHERAGSRNVIHMHGELRKVRCTACGAVHPWLLELHSPSACPTCQRSGTLRPHIVWFGEVPFGLPQIEQALATCGAFVAIGTSGLVYPAAALVDTVPPGTPTWELNLDPALNSQAFQHHHPGPATRTVPALVEAWLGPLDSQRPSPSV